MPKVFVLSLHRSGTQSAGQFLHDRVAAEIRCAQCDIARWKRLCPSASATTSMRTQEASARGVFRGRPVSNADYSAFALVRRELSRRLRDESVGDPFGEGLGLVPLKLVC